MEACSSQGKFNVTTYNAMSMAIITLQTFAGMWINAFIVSVLCVSWVKKRSFNSNEKILLFLGCVRFCYFCITWVYSFLKILYQCRFYAHHLAQLFSAIQSFFSFSNLWVSAFLSVFYCIKIANFQHTFFIYLKMRIDRIVPWLMLASVLVSLVISFLIYGIADEALNNNHNSTAPGNIWKLNIKMDRRFFPIFFISGFEYVAAFIAVISSALLLLFSLWRHKHKMQAKSGKNVSVDAHIKAMKSILSFLLIYSIHFICAIMELIYATKKATAVMIVISLFKHSFPSIYSLILIFSNPKLEETLIRTLSCLKCKICMK
ncbi:taste receptor type 2 member 9-like [Calypte anna]|uniref:taste receptor type 2 member 9-like n=1 Tax=Calypte anna TaxID=9244 RepID=UPI0011C4A986|nr:taste receptor type 2 member 9-like [Calypte anna]